MTKNQGDYRCLFVSSASGKALPAAVGNRHRVEGRSGPHRYKSHLPLTSHKAALLTGFFFFFGLMAGPGLFLELLNGIHFL